MSLAQTRIRQFLGFLSFFRKAQTLYDLHSPFLVPFIEHTLDDDRTFYAFNSIEAYRNNLLHNNTRLPIYDLGAGSRVHTQNQRTVSDIARATSIPPRVGQWLFKTVHFFQPDTMVELGTSLGISAMYQSAARPAASFFTLEGNPSVASFSQKQLSAMGLPRVQVIPGGFDETLPQLLKDLARVDYAFLDGNHQLDPTMRYVDWLIPRMKPESLIVVADIYWSDDMKAAWKALQQLPEVRASVDVYDFGILFFSSAFRQKQHWRLVPRRWKPWKLGIRAPMPS